jgi:enoyl-CoA hydratase
MGTNDRTTGFEKKEHTAIITIPGFTADHIGTDTFSCELAELCTDIEMDDDVRVVIITEPAEETLYKKKQAKGPLPSSPRGEASLLSPHPSESITGLDRPTIAAIHGGAFGLGLELAMACDIRIASESSCFGSPYIHEGLLPQDGGTQRLPRLVGKGKALEMILTGEPIDAGEALRIGLVNMVQSSGDVTKKVLGLAREMASKAPISLRFVREAIYKGMDLTLDQGLRLEGDLYLLLYGTRDRVHGIESFQKKQKPSFQGR